jgi:hypothetical protein
MTGMGGPNRNDPSVVAAFHQTLLYQGFIVAGILVAVLVIANLLWAQQMREAGQPHPERSRTGDDRGRTDAPARRVLRVGFGLLWILDGVLQGQASMPQHLMPAVVLPAAQGSPGWLVSLVHDASMVWTHHQASAAAAAVWVQIGLGGWLLVAPRGRWSRAAGLTSAAWGAVVWVVGESLGGLLAPGPSWLEGAPGSALLYVVAGTLMALPDHYWKSASVGRNLCRTLGGVVLGAAVLQAWPGRDSAGDLARMARQMAGTRQPGWIQGLVRGVSDHAGVVDVTAIVAMFLVGAALVASGPRRPGLTVTAAAATGVLCLVDWVAVQDLGFLGGVGTDPNSMLPWIVLVAVGAVAAGRPATGLAEPPRDSSYRLRSVATVAAIAVTVVGTAPLAADVAVGAGAPIEDQHPLAVLSASGCLPCTTSSGVSIPH